MCSHWFMNDNKTTFWKALIKSDLGDSDKKGTTVLMCVKALNHLSTKPHLSRSLINWPELLNYSNLHSCHNDLDSALQVKKRQRNGRDVNWDTVTAPRGCIEMSAIYFSLSPRAGEQSHRYGRLPKLNDIQLPATQIKDTSPHKEPTSNQSEGTPSVVLQPRLRDDDGLLLRRPTTRLWRPSAMSRQSSRIYVCGGSSFTMLEIHVGMFYDKSSFLIHLHV